MADINFDELGPVDYVVVGFPADKADFSGAMADELKKLMESGTVRVLDLLLVTKDEDGSISVAELRDHDDSVVGELRSLEADLSLMLAVEDVERIGGDLELGSAAAVLVWENTWAAPFASAVRHSGGELLAMGRIPTQALIAAAEEDREAAQAEA
jgi:fructosamine-3-kinase